MSSNLPPTFRYWAFISYSRRDARWGRWVQRRLEHYRIPPSLVGTKQRWGLVPPRLRPVFLDKLDLPSASNISDALKANLRSSHALIVICSPNSAASRWVSAETEEFEKLGRDHHIFCLIVDGDPDTPIADLIPAPLRRDEDALPLASDLRPGRDSRSLAIRKLVAGILDVSPDELVARAAQQRRRRTMAGVFASTIAAGALGAGYVGVADTGLRVPAGEAVRTWLDSRDASVFRAVPPRWELVDRARVLQRRVVENIAGRPRVDGGWVINNPNRTPCYDVWSHSQVTSGILMIRDPAIVDQQRAVLEGLLAPQHGRQGEGTCPDQRMRVNAHQDEVMLVGAWWHVWALAEALRRPDLLDEATLADVRAGLAAMAKTLRPERVAGDAPGTWMMWPWAEDRSQASPFTATLALIALTALHDADEPWRGSASARDAEASATARWLLRAYRPDSERGGWVEPTDFNGTEAYDGLRYQTIEALLRAEARGLVELPEAMLLEWEGFLLAVGDRPLDHPMMSAAVAVTVRPPGGERSTVQESMAFQWHPWAIRALVAWLERPESPERPPEVHTRLRRALAHLVLELGEPAVQKTANEWLWQPAELCIGLAAIQPR